MGEDAYADNRWCKFEKFSLTCSQSLHGHGWVGHGVGISRSLEVLGLSPGPVLVVRVILHVLRPDALGLVNEGSLFRFCQRLPLTPQSF